jgi:hypothetical protein
MTSQGGVCLSTSPAQVPPWMIDRRTMVPSGLRSPGCNRHQRVKSLPGTPIVGTKNLGAGIQSSGVRHGWLRW